MNNQRFPTQSKHYDDYDNSEKKDSRRRSSRGSKKSRRYKEDREEFETKTDIVDALGALVIAINNLNKNVKSQSKLWKHIHDSALRDNEESFKSEVQVEPARNSWDISDDDDEDPARRRNQRSHR